jgi:nucleotide-binding universal stress UspA family protein
MKALVGIDGTALCDVALRLLARFRPEGLEVVLVHVVESVLPDGGFPGPDSDHPVAEIHREREREGRAQLEAARTFLLDQGISADLRLERGAPARMILKTADEMVPDLIVVGAEATGRWGSLFFGSVAKAMVTGSRRNLLVAKKAPAEDRPLTAIFATDHSAYADQCLNVLLQLRPQGLGRVYVLTANEIDAGTAAMLVHGLGELADDAETWVTEKLTERTQKTADRLAALGVECVPMVREGHPNDVIEQAMTETGADLLILGAQGHGFLDRLTMGSVSFYQVVSSPHSVLVLRP